MSLVKRSDATRMLEDTKTLTTFGGRSTGSEGEHKAGDFFKERLEKSGFEVREELFMTEAFEEYEAYLEVEGEKYGSKAMFFSEPTDEEGIEGELVFAGTGTEEDLKDLDLEGKIPIFHRDPKIAKDQFWPEVSQMAKKGALGAVLINFDDWVFITTLESGLFEASKRFIPMEPENIPAAVIGRETGNKILRKMENQKVIGKLYIDAFRGRRESKNIIGVKKGSELPDERILIYGHRDTVGNLGANDNGSGTVIMMEIARILGEIDTKRTIEIISFGAEEQLGSVGSIEYLEKHKDELDSIKASIELDMVGSGSSLKVMEGGNWPDTVVNFDKDLCEFVANTAAELGYHVDLDYCELGSPDSGRFSDAGVPTTWIWGDGDIYYHSPEDTWDKVDPNKLKAASDIVLVSVYKLANK